MDDECFLIAEHKRNLSIGQAEMLGERLATRQDYGRAVAQHSATSHLIQAGSVKEAAPCWKQHTNRAVTGAAEWQCRAGSTGVGVEQTLRIETLTVGASFAVHHAGNGGTFQSINPLPRCAVYSACVRKMRTVLRIMRV